MAAPASMIPKSRDSILWGGTKSTSMREVTLTCMGTEESITFSLCTTTKVSEVKTMIALKTDVNESNLLFIQKGKLATSTRPLRDTEEMRSNVIVKGIKDFVRHRHKWAFPFGIIGAGHAGLRQALSFQIHGDDYAVFDKLPNVGGGAWVVNPNTSSKLQTELGNYYLQFYMDFPVPKGLPTQPSAAQLRQHFHQVCEECGLLPNIHLGQEVKSTQPNPGDGYSQSFTLSIGKPQVAGAEAAEAAEIPDDGENYIAEVEEPKWNFQVSAIGVFPGGLCVPRRADYVGEDIFDGQIAYGISDEFDYKRVEREKVAIIGMGAFGTENVRTCLEHSAEHISVIVRRRNLPMPRIVSWFINQGLYPAEGARVMHMMEKMYDLIPDGGSALWDPAEYYGVMANNDRTKCTVRQKGRFGIGDVYFLASMYGMVVTVVDEIKRLSVRSIVLHSGGRLSMDHIIKCLGFKADPDISRIMNIRFMEGNFINGDVQTFLWSESPGIDAGNFGNTSFSPGAMSSMESFTYLLHFPKDSQVLLGQNILPKQKAHPDPDYPVYIWQARSATTVGLMLGSIPGIVELTATFGQFARDRTLELHPLETFMAELEVEWDNYISMLERVGYNLEPRPKYPYTVEYMAEMVQEQDEEGLMNFQRMMKNQSG